MNACSCINICSDWQIWGLAIEFWGLDRSTVVGFRSKIREIAAINFQIEVIDVYSLRYDLVLSLVYKTRNLEQEGKRL
jgi:hypothetical protein